MDLAIVIDYASLRIGRHPRRACWVSAFKKMGLSVIVVEPRGWLRNGQSKASEFQKDDLPHAPGSTPFELADLPMDTGKRHSQRVDGTLC
jgi:hypothetical protein